MEEMKLYWIHASQLNVPGIALGVSFLCCGFVSMGGSAGIWVVRIMLDII